jgi:hypothetical protein
MITIIENENQDIKLLRSKLYRKIKRARSLMLEIHNLKDLINKYNENEQL